MLANRPCTKPLTKPEVLYANLQLLREPGRRLNKSASAFVQGTVSRLVYFAVA